MKRFINSIIAILKRELFAYFSSAVAYVFIVIFLILMGVFTFFISKFYEAGQADLAAFFQWHPWLYLFLVPAIAMRLWAEERHQGTIELILTYPITLAEAILGKFLAAWIFIGISLALTFPIVFTVAYLGNPDLGAICCSYIGSFLVAGAYLSVGSMTSSLSRSQVISFVLAIVICLIFVLAGFPVITDIFSGWLPLWMVEIISNLSFFHHYVSIERGVIDLRDILFYFSFITFMLCANAVILQNRKTS